jgi:hypothetical protein
VQEARARCKLDERATPTASGNARVDLAAGVTQCLCHVHVYMSGAAAEGSRRHLVPRRRLRPLPHRSYCLFTCPLAKYNPGPSTAAIGMSFVRSLRSLSAQKTVSYGLQASARAPMASRLARRQFTTVMNPRPPRLRRMHAQSYTAAFRNLHARALSFSSIPRFVVRAFRVPIAGATVGAGGFTYANYKFEGTHPLLFMCAWYENLRVRARAPSSERCVKGGLGCLA